MLQTSTKQVCSTYLDAEEHRTHLSQPLRIYSSHTLHVLLAGVYQLVIHNVVWGVAKPIKGTAGVQKARHAAATVVVFANALELGRVVEVGAADSFADDVPI